MRTTVRLDEQLLREAKVEAARTGRSLTSLLDEALRARLAKTRPRTQAVPALPTFRGRGLCPGVDLDDGVLLRDLMDAPRGAD